MALTKCEECKKKISSIAETCPFCGISDPTIPRKKCVECKKMVLSTETKCPFCEAEHPTENRIKCKKCKKKFPITMDKCLHCGASAPRWPKIVASISLILIVGMIVLSVFDSDDSNDTKKANSNAVVARDEIGAYVYMKQIVEGKLKAPKSADFASYNDSFVRYLGSDRYKVKSYVDSQNSFGALIRTHFEGVIKRIYVDGQGGWHLEKIDFQQQ